MAWLSLFILVLSAAFCSAKPLSCEDTKQHILPACFGYFENLYFDPIHKRFYTLGKNADLSKAIFTGQPRGFSCNNYRYLPFSKNVFHTIPGLTLILFERTLASFHYCNFYHILDHLMGLWNFGGEENRNNVNLLLIAGEGDIGPKNWKGLNDTNLHLIKALFPNAEIKLLAEFINESSKDFCFTHVLTSDRCMAYLKEPFFTDRMLGSYFRDLSLDSINRMSMVISDYFGAKKNQSEKCIVTYVRRFYPRHLRADIEKQLFDKIKQLPNVELRIVDFAFSAFKDQVHAAVNTDVLLGVHGNGLCHTLFLPKGATLIELFPKDCLRMEYRILAELRQLSYWGMMSGRGWIEDQTAEKMGAFGDPQILVEDIDIDVIISVIQNCTKLK